MKYGDKVVRMEGIITEVHDGAIAVDFKGRLGSIKVPKRMVISDYDLEVGQTVAWKMSFIEQESPEVDQKYVHNIEYQNDRIEKLSNSNNNEED